MPKLLPLAAAAFVALVPLYQGNSADAETTRQIQTLDAAISELRNPRRDITPESRASRGHHINQGLVVLTGEAVNPLVGITALGMYNYFRTPEHLRPHLAVYDQPQVWIPLLVLLCLMLFNSTIGEAIPFLKSPLNAMGDLINKAGAVAVLPLVVSFFADTVSQPLGEQIAWLSTALSPVAHAGEWFSPATAGNTVGWIAGAVAGTIIYLSVWLTFNMVDVFIVLCPFPGVDALLKSLRLSILGLLATLYHISPAAASVMACAIILVSFLLAGWSFRLSVFGAVFSTDLLFFRRRRQPKSVLAFSSSGMEETGLPIRTLGRLTKDDGGEVIFRYRPWLILPSRSLPLGGTPEGGFLCGQGLLYPAITDGDGHILFRLAPRYRGCEPWLSSYFSLQGIVPCGMALTAWEWVKELAGYGKSSKAEPSAGL